MTTASATKLGLVSSDIQACLRSIATDESDVETFADITWSLISEPGDGIAGMLISRLGSANALELVINRSSVAKARELASELGVDMQDLEAFGQFDQQFKDSLSRWLPRLSQKAVAEATDAMRVRGGQVVTVRDSEWPQQLHDLEFNAPKLLWLLGNRETLESSQRSVAIVGSRASTSYGEYVVGELVSTANQIFHAVISGGAYGIDAAAHRNALALSVPTVSVLAGGLDSLYPKGNKTLLNRVRQQGALISEVAPGIAPTKWRFLQRNRIIAALAQATVVVEAGSRSGARNTANHAIELGRPLGAIPGSIMQPASAGCNELIQSGKAMLLQKPDDLKMLLGIQEAVPLFELEGLGGYELRALDAIGFHKTSFEEIQLNSGLAGFELATALGSLELQGLITRVHAAWQRIRVN